MLDIFVAREAFIRVDAARFRERRAGNTTGFPAILGIGAIQVVRPEAIHDEPLAGAGRALIRRLSRRRPCRKSPATRTASARRNQNRLGPRNSWACQRRAPAAPKRRPSAASAAANTLERIAEPSDRQFTHNLHCTAFMRRDIARPTDGRQDAAGRRIRRNCGRARRRTTRRPSPAYDARVFLGGSR